MTVHPRALDYPQSFLSGVIPDEAELTAGGRVEPGRSYGFFTDTTLCIGCKACEVACKEWNALPADDLGLRGTSYDNTGDLSATTWRHAHFIEHIAENGERATAMPPFQSNWLMMSDVCKHCSPAPCLEACPTGALFRTEFDTVVVQQDICNGCGYCVPACPFGVVDVSLEDGKAHKCTLCYDRLKGGLEPACAKSCPTDSIQFGELEELHARAHLAGGGAARQERRGCVSLWRPRRYWRPAAAQCILSADRRSRNTQSAAHAEPPRRAGGPESHFRSRHGRRSRSGQPSVFCGSARGPTMTDAPPLSVRVADERDVTYYDLPSVKPSLWGGLVSGYMFVAGVGGSVQIIATAADLVGDRALAPIIRNGRYIALGATVLGGPLLTIDLHTPQRWYNMLRIFRKTSPMSIGTWVLMSFGSLSAALAAAQFASDHGHSPAGRYER
jgi:formate dehydrogenase iron-sulfur subunit